MFKIFADSAPPPRADLELGALPVERGELGVPLHDLPDVILRHLNRRAGRLGPIA